MKHKKAMLLIMLFGFFFTAMHAQKAVVSVGGNGNSPAGSVSYSVGQTFYKSPTGTTGSISQGVQQVYEITEIARKEPNQVEDEMNAGVYPNPVVSGLTISVHQSNPQNLNYFLFDYLGKNITDGKITTEETLLNMENLASGSYILKLISDNKEIKTFKIIKH